MTNTQISKYQLNLSPFFWVLFGLLAINALLFIFFTASPHVRSDVWRHLENVVIPFLDGSEGWSILWSNHHPSPLLHIIQIINIKFLGFRLDYEAYLGFVFQLLITVFIVNRVLSATKGEPRNTHIVDYLCALLITVIALGFNSLDQYTWPLLTTVQYLYFFGLVVFLATDRCIQEASRLNYLALAAACLLSMFANADYGTIFLISVLAILFIISMLERRATYLRPALVIFCVWIVYFSVLHAVIPESPYRPSSSLLSALVYLLQDPLATLTQFSMGLFAGVVDIVSIKGSFPAVEPYLPFIALLLFMVYFFVFVSYLKKGAYRVSIAPLALMSVTVMFAASVLLNRTIFIGHNPWGLTAPRYVPTFKLGVIGMIWAIWQMFKISPPASGFYWRRPASIVLVLVTSLILILQVAQIIRGWSQEPGIRENNENGALAIYLAGKPSENAISLPFSVIGFSKPGQDYHHAMNFLKENELSVFSDEFPESDLLDRHIHSKMQFYASDIFKLVEVTGGNYKETITSPDEVDVNWKAGPGKLVISSKSERPVYVRVRIRSNGGRRTDMFVTFGSGRERTSPIYSILGEYTLFLTLEKGRQLKIRKAVPFDIVEFELRI